MHSRTAAIMLQTGLSRASLADALCCDPTTISRLSAGRAETRAQTRLLDLLVEARGLSHLHSTCFPAAGLASAGAAPGVAPPAPGAAESAGVEPPAETLPAVFSEQHGCL